MFSPHVFGVEGCYEIYTFKFIGFKTLSNNLTASKLHFKAKVLVKAILKAVRFSY